MSNSKAARRKDTADVLKGIKKEKRDLNAISRRNASGTGPVSFGTVSTNMGVSVGFNPNIQIGTGLKVGGDVMMGPIAYNSQEKTLASGVLTLTDLINTVIGISGTSWTIVNGEGGSADDLVTINGAVFSGQILYLQAKNQAITLKTTGNIHTNDNADVVLSAFNSGAGTGGEVATLIYDDKVTGGNWVVVNVGAGGGSSGAGLADNNVWTGTNQFTGSYVTVTGSFSATGASITLGDASTDIINFGGKAGSNLNMGHYDIDSLDRLLFSTTGTDNLAASDMGIGTNSGDSDYLTYNVPSGYHRFKVNGNLAMSVGPTSNPGLTVENSLWVSGTITATGNVTFQQEVTLGNSSSDDINIVGNIDTDISMAASKKIRAYTSTEIGYFVKNATSAVGSEGTIQIPTKNSGVGNASAADSDFGSEIGCIGLYTLGNPTLVIKYSSSGWQGIIFGSSGNPTQYQF